MIDIFGLPFYEPVFLNNIFIKKGRIQVRFGKPNTTVQTFIQVVCDIVLKSCKKINKSKLYPNTLRINIDFLLKMVVIDNVVPNLVKIVVLVEFWIGIFNAVLRGIFGDIQKEVLYVILVG